MQGNAVEALQLGGAMIDTDMSMWALFIRADVVVKLVMAVLLLASVWCWAIIFEKWLRLRRVRPDLERPFRSPLYPLFPVLYVVIALGVVVGNTVTSPPRITLLGLGVLAAGALAYVPWRRSLRSS